MDVVSSATVPLTFQPEFLQAHAQTHYGDPFTAGCLSDEVKASVTGVDGSFCAPECSGFSCPTDKPSGVSATPQCALQTSGGAKYCALICTPNAIRTVTDSECGTNASCKAISGIGICTYDS